MSKLIIVPDQKYEELTLDLKRQLASLAKELRSEHLADLIGADGAFLVKPDPNGDSKEIEIWGKSPAGFVVVWTSKGKDDPVVGAVTAEPGRGLINQVFESGRAEVKADDFLNAPDWTNLEKQRGAKLHRMAAHPITIFRRCVAVLSLSEFQDARATESDGQVGMRTAGASASLLSRLMEDRLIRSCLGFDSR